ncbi:MAG: Rne/Rng family ribonuclease [Puniceicoccales bacterium]|jgi:ribonuclease G|nr:Rne/Rng family ribonuclease [Puniceicoccales bacterium]
MSEKHKSGTAVSEELRRRPQEIVADVIDSSELGDEARQRAKKQPLIQRIIKNISRGDGKFRELIVSRNFAETRLALLVDGRMEAFEVERIGSKNYVGAIFKGRIQNLESGLRAAFVITGQERNAFLHYWDMLPAANDSFEIISGKQSRREISVEDIPKMYPVGSEIVVQVTKASIGTKGPRVTTNIAIPGRYMILTPYNGQCGISRRVGDGGERERLKKILHSLAVPNGMGVIIRTAGSGKKLKCFVRDLSILLRRWQGVVEKMAKLHGPGLLYCEPDLVGRAVRDFLTDDVDRITVDSEEVHGEISGAVGEALPRMRSRVHLYDGIEPIFEHFKAEKQIVQIFSRRVPLPSGGEIVIEETEALIAIDVNSGSHRCRKRDDGDYMLHVNLEAAEEIVRQMRLRNLGGLIIIDFVDMVNAADQKRLCDLMQKMLEQDSERFQILPISPFGLMQISRQRRSQSVDRDTRRQCPYCGGRGTVESAQSTAVRLLAKLMVELKKAAAATEKLKRSIRIVVHGDVMEVLRQLAADQLGEIEKDFAVDITIAADETIHRENFSIEMP